MKNVDVDVNVVEVGVVGVVEVGQRVVDNSMTEGESRQNDTCIFLNMAEMDLLLSSKI